MTRNDPPGARTAELLARKARAVPEAITLHAPLFAARGEGARLWDVEGRMFIDLVGGVGCLNVGHSHPRIVAAIQAQAARLTHSDFSIVPYEGYVALAERLAATVPGAGPWQTALFNSGAEAVENAVKVARLATGRSAVLAFEGAFHGRTYMALSLTGRIDPYKRGLGPFAPDIHRAPYPDPYRLPARDPAAFVFDTIERMFHTTVDPRQVAAIIVEPVLGEGGFVVPPSAFLPGLRALCDRIGALLIVDEVQTGFGRTGRMWAVEHSGVEPDLLIAGKSIAAGLPLSAVVGRQAILARVPANAVGGTYVGNPVACAAALAVLDVIEEERLIARAVWLGRVLRHRFEVFARHYPLIGEVRGLGAMMAIELVRDRTTREPAPEEAEAVVARSLEEGVLLLRAGIYRNVIRILAPLVISEDDLETALAAIGRALASTQERARPPRAKASGE
jgi:4-aminobutyrate aminotransferase/(S)-3-amino-2-methylpropionate transaminase